MSSWTQADIPCFPFILFYEVINSYGPLLLRMLKKIIQVCDAVNILDCAL